MMKSWIEGLSIAAFLTLMVFAVPQDAMTGTLTVPAPKETASIHLGVKDPPASAFLEGWWCSEMDLKKTVMDLFVTVDNRIRQDFEEDAVEAAVNFEFNVIKKGWPFKLAGMRKSPTKTGLDAPPGGTKIYKFKYCYTADELQTVQDKIQQFIDLVAAGKYDTYDTMGVQKEISDWLDAP